jgi:hypothetical protein
MAQWFAIFFKFLLANLGAIASLRLRNLLLKPRKVLINQMLNL